MGLFTCARFHALESAHIHVTSSKEVHLRSGDITALLGLFYAAVSASHVRTLNLTMICISLQSDDDFPPLRDLLASILPLRDLRTFTLTGVLRVMPVDDADFVALARAWPTLERLNISDGTTSESAVSLGALHHFASACPSLQELSLPGLVYPVVGVHVIPEPPLASSPERPPHPLRQLRVRTVLVPKTDPQSISDESAEAFARYLLELFPNLDGWEYMPKPPRPREPSPEPGPPGRRRPGISMSSFVAYDGRWWAVARRIYALCAAREEAKLSFSA
ncbi:hypothetical protein GSI_14900 [Ganoderma sinense ZZ0214-1]|uniref:Uncharacterized protein n=1 Tax=Ganoderma sinense ZZ0214-1 TaxID=1077348 RepID=A0A2G8RQ07_9APHY|nr:hypothetical protein GSI_14900 [Ganoderma sinense ZZ0214-1]